MNLMFMMRLFNCEVEDQPVYMFPDMFRSILQNEGIIGLTQHENDFMMIMCNVKLKYMICYPQVIDCSVHHGCNTQRGGIFDTFAASLQVIGNAMHQPDSAHKIMLIIQHMQHAIDITCHVIEEAQLDTQDVRIKGSCYLHNSIAVSYTHLTLPTIA